MAQHTTMRNNRMAQHTTMWNDRMAAPPSSARAVADPGHDLVDLGVHLPWGAGTRHSWPGLVYLTTLCRYPTASTAGRGSVGAGTVSQFSWYIAVTVCSSPVKNPPKTQHGSRQNLDEKGGRLAHKMQVGPTGMHGAFLWEYS
jgi:hypothetical protein